MSLKGRIGKTAAEIEMENKNQSHTLQTAKAEKLKEENELYTQRTIANEDNF